jgi:SH3-like domain-containing protein
MMKKRIVALLLAGLMSAAALTSCRVQNTNPGGTEPQGSTPTQTTPTPDNPYQPPVETWQDVNKSVFTFNEVKLRQQATNTGTALATIPKETELHCTKQSTSWYYVEYKKGEETISGYVSKASVTEANILGTDMVEVDGGSKVMYVKTTTLNVRLYPSDNDNFSTKMGSYKLNEAVTVLATNGTWARVQYAEGKIYYVAYAYLSDTEVEDPNDETKYEGLFNDVDGTPTMYVDNVSQVKFRKAPNTSSDELLALAKGAAVTVLKTGEVDGKQWAYAVVEVAPTKPGDAPTYVKGYISFDCLSYTNGDMTVDQLIARYPTFEKTDVTVMYVVVDSAITIRSNPVFPEEGEDNSLSNPKSTAESVKSLKILATGVVDETQWFIVEYVKKDGENEKVITGFIANGAMKYLTTDPNGKVTLTPDDVLVKYPNQFVKLETPVTVTTNALANCYGTPETAKEPLKQLAAGTTVTLVATPIDNFTNWALIQDAEGAYYFVNYSFLNQAQ